MSTSTNIYDQLSRSKRAYFKRKYGINDANELESWLNVIPDIRIGSTGLPNILVSQFLKQKKYSGIQEVRRRTLGYRYSDSIKKSWSNRDRKQSLERFINIKPEGVDHSHRFNKVSDQGNAPSCTGFASAYAISSALDFKYEISGGFIYNRAKAIDGDQSAGSYLSSCTSAMSEFGICREVDHPYNIPDLLDEPSVDAIIKAKKIRLEHWDDLKDFSLTQLIIDYLNKGYVVVVGALVFDSSWNNDIANNYGKILEPYPSEEPIGGHAITITGYKPDVNAPGGGNFIFINSWGHLWGSHTKYCNAGFGIMSFQYANNYIIESYVVKKVVNQWTGDKNVDTEMEENEYDEMIMNDNNEVDGNPFKFLVKVAATILIVLMFVSLLGSDFKWLDQFTSEMHDKPDRVRISEFAPKMLGDEVKSGQVNPTHLKNLNATDTKMLEVSNSDYDNNEQSAFSGRGDTLNHIYQVLMSNSSESDLKIKNSENIYDADYYRNRQLQLEQIQRILLD